MNQVRIFFKGEEESPPLTLHNDEELAAAFAQRRLSSFATRVEVRFDSRRSDITVTEYMLICPLFSADRIAIISFPAPDRIGESELLIYDGTGRQLYVAPAAGALHPFAAGSIAHSGPVEFRAPVVLEGRPHLVVNFMVDKTWTQQSIESRAFDPISGEWHAAWSQFWDPNDNNGHGALYDDKGEAMR